MGKPTFIEKVFKFMGDNPDSATIAAASIAVFKGIFRPMFTLMDKKSEPETKKYAAIREGLTEGIAIPIYLAVPTIGGKLIVDNFYKTASAATKKAVNANVKFIAVLASTAIIPAVCNLVQPPIMNAIQKNKKKSEDITTVASVQPPNFKGRYNLPKRNISYNNYGMRVGS